MADTMYLTIELKDPVFGYIKAEGKWVQVKCVTAIHEPDGVCKSRIVLPDGSKRIVDNRKVRHLTPKVFVRHPEAPLNVYYTNTICFGD